MRKISIFLALLAALLASCAFAAKNSPKPVTAATPEEAQAHEFRIELGAMLKALENGDDSAFLAALDKASAVKDAADGIAADELVFVERAKLAAEDVAHELERKTHQCGQTRIVRVRSEGDSTFALVRLDYGDASWGWADMELAPALDGSMRIVDIINYSTGLDLVQTVRMDAAPLLEKEDSVAKLYKITPTRTDAVKKLAGLLKKLQEGEYAEAVTAWYDLPPDLHGKKEVALLGLKAAALAGNPTSHGRIMKEISETLGSDPMLAYMLAEYFFSIDQDAEALAKLEKFEKTGAGADASIMSMKANALTGLGRSREALALAHKAIAAEPEVQDAYWAELMAQCTEGDFAGAVQTAKTLEDKFEYKLDEDALSKSETYAGFVRSRDYQAWRALIDEE